MAADPVVAFQNACSAASNAIAGGSMPTKVSDDLGAAAGAIDPVIGKPVLDALAFWQSSGEHWSRVMPKPLATALAALAAPVGN